MRVAVIGGAGFIGSHLVDALVSQGCQVRVVDNLEAQVHPTGRLPEYLNRQAEFVQQDVRDAEGLRQALAGVEFVFHVAGAVGVGDSMYRVRHYADVNVVGGASLLEALAAQKHTVRKVVVASTVTVYGEGKYSCPQHGVVSPLGRSAEQVRNRQWEPECPRANGSTRCTQELTPLATDEETHPMPLSVYAMTKRVLEEMFLGVGRSYGIPVTVLRYFNVYGSRQAPSNPYTGVVKIFASEIAAGRTPLIYEDGLQTRDLVHVSDIVQANLLAMKPEANGEIFNVGTGRPTTVLSMAEAIAHMLGRQIKSVPSLQCRAGDVRHCWANIEKIQKKLGFEPKVVFPAHLEDVVSAARADCESLIAEAHSELANRGLIS